MTLSDTAAVAEAARGAAVGTQLPQETIDVTTTLIVTGAIASRDFYLGHHDRDAAQAAGSKDVFMNVMTTLGLVERYVTSWTGPNALMRSIGVKLGTSNYPGDRMVLSGTVTAVEDTDEGRLLTLAVQGENSRGAHVRATVAGLLPS
jgi:acyl dehydratase